MSIYRRYATAVASAFLLMLSIALGTIWQAQGRAHQQLDIGTSLDDSAVLHFHEAEHRSDNRDVTFRWTEASSEIRLWALHADTPAIVTLRMFPPSTSGSTVTLSIGGQLAGSMRLSDSTRNYRLLARVPNENELAIGIQTERRAQTTDPRFLGAGIDQVAIDSAAPFATAWISELWSAPFLPLGLLLLALCAWLMACPKLLIGATPALALGILALIDHSFPNARLRCSSYIAAIAIMAIVVIALVILLRRLPRLWPNTDPRARNWLVGIFIVTVLLTFTPAIRSDGIGYYVYLRSLAMDGDVDFGNDYRDWPNAAARSYLNHRTDTGAYTNFFSIGPALLWSPFYAVAHIIMTSGVAAGMPWHADGYAEPYFVLTTFASALAGLIIMLAGYQICRRWVGPPIALLAVLATFFGSNLLYYTMREGGFAHGFSAATATLYLLAWLRLEEQPSLRRWIGLGISAGLMIVMYWISAIVLLLPLFTGARLLLAALRSPAPERRSALTRLFSGMALALGLIVLLFSPQMLAWKASFGSFLTIPQGSGFVSPQAFAGKALLFSPLHGLLPWTPALFFGGLSLVLLWRRNRYYTGVLLLALVAYFLYNAWLPNWHGSGAFGLRRLTLLAPWCMLGLALLFEQLHRWRPLLPVPATALMAGWTTCVLLRYDLELIPHQPEKLYQMSPAAFYLSREIFPLWAVQGWIRNSYVMRSLRDIFIPSQTVQIVAIFSVMSLATWFTVWVATRWLSRQQVGEIG